MSQENIQQKFRSNTKMAQTLFKKLLDDGREHSFREICDYIFDECDGRGVDGERMTAETVHSAIWYMFRHDRDFRYAQTRKGYYQKNNMENLLGGGDSGLRQYSMRLLNDAKEKIRLHAALPGLSGEEKAQIQPVLKRYLKAIEIAADEIQAADFGQVTITADNLEINGLHMVDECGFINAHFQQSFDEDSRFGTELYGTDGYMNLYAEYYPEDDRLDVFYIIYHNDGTDDGSPEEAVYVEDISDNERETILQLMRDAGLDECIAEMNEDQDAGMTLQ